MIKTFSACPLWHFRKCLYSEVKYWAGLHAAVGRQKLLFAWPSKPDVGVFFCNICALECKYLLFFWLRFQYWEPWHTDQRAHLKAKRESKSSQREKQKKRTPRLDGVLLKWFLSVEANAGPGVRPLLVDWEQIHLELCLITTCHFPFSLTLGHCSLSSGSYNYPWNQYFHVFSCHSNPTSHSS